MVEVKGVLMVSLGEVISGGVVSSLLIVAIGGVSCKNMDGMERCHVFQSGH